MTTIDNRELIKALKQATVPPPSRLQKLKVRFYRWALMTAAIGGGTILLMLDRVGHLFGFCAGGH